jgi:hypothetical protein
MSLYRAPGTDERGGIGGVYHRARIRATRWLFRPLLPFATPLGFAMLYPCVYWTTNKVPLRVHFAMPRDAIKSLADTR